MKVFNSPPLQGDLFQDFVKPTAIRPIHYLGSKLRIVDFIAQAINRVEPSGGPVCDLFAGSGTVSSYLSENRDVTSVDIQEYSRVLCSALLHPSDFNKESIQHLLCDIRSSEHNKLLCRALEPLINHEAKCQARAFRGDLEPLCELLENGSIIGFELDNSTVKDPLLHFAMKESSFRLRKYGLVDSPSVMVSRYFGGIYFSYSQASQIDSLLEAVASLPQTQKDTFLAAILSTASEVVNTVGKQFAQPIRPRTSEGKPKANIANQVARDRLIDVIKTFESWLKRYLTIPNTGRPHRVIRSNFTDALKRLKSEVSVIYADPPYTRDHYSRYYHVLETICLRDNPTISTVRINGEDRISRGLYRTERYQSPFCIKSRAPKAFSTLFSEVRELGVPLILSYSPYEQNSGARPRLMTIKEIEILVRKYFGRVKIISAGSIAHNKLNTTEKNAGMSYEAEVLIICEP